MIEKPDVLSDDKIDEAWPSETEAKLPRTASELPQFVEEIRRCARIVAQAQRDADYEHEQNTIRGIFEEIEKYHKSYRYALIAGSRKEDTYDLHIKGEAWEGYKDKFLKEAA